MAKVEVGDPLDAAPPGSAQIVVAGVGYALPLGDIIDLNAEKARLSKAAEAAEKERDGLAARLSNANFTERAKPEAVEKARADHDVEVHRGGAPARRWRLGNRARAEPGPSCALGSRRTRRTRASGAGDARPRAGVRRRVSPSIDTRITGRVDILSFVAAEFAHRLVPRSELERARRRSSSRAGRRFGRDRLDDDLAAFDVGAFDQLDPAVEAAVGDPDLGRPQPVRPPAIVDLAAGRR